MITEYSQLQILRAIKDDTSQPKMAKEIGYSIDKVNFILKELAKKRFDKNGKLCKLKQ